MPIAGWEKAGSEQLHAFYEKHKPDMIICPVQIEPHRIFRKISGTGVSESAGNNSWFCIIRKRNNVQRSKPGFYKGGIYDRHTENLHYEIASGDDIFLLHSLKKQTDSKILWLESTDAIVTTEASPTISSYLKQRKRWISKSKAYTDRNTITPWNCNICYNFTSGHRFLLPALINHAFMPVFLTIFLLEINP